MTVTSLVNSPHRLRNIADVLVIGAGPAGLSALLAPGRVLRRAVVFDSDEYRNASSSHAHTIPLHDHENPAKIRHEMEEELKRKYKRITFANTAVKTVRDVDGIFEVVSGTGQVWKGRKVILASASYDVLPTIPGYVESWGKGILHCPFCRGFEEYESGLSNAAFLITDTSSSDVENLIFYGQFVRRFTQNITLLLNGNSQSTPYAKISAIALTCGMRISTKEIKQFIYTGTGALMRVLFSDGTEETFGFVFHEPETCLRRNFDDQLGLELTPSSPWP